VPLLISCLAVPGCGGDGAGGEAASDSADAVGAATADNADLSPDQQKQMAMIAELQAIDQQLAPMRDQVFQDPAFQVRQQALLERIETAMESAFPGSLAKRNRFDSLAAEFQAAQGAADTARVQTLSAELQTLEGELREAQTQAMETPDIKQALEKFREDLFEKVRLVDPSADSLIKRGEELNAQLTTSADTTGS